MVTNARNVLKYSARTAIALGVCDTDLKPNSAYPFFAKAHGEQDRILGQTTAGEGSSSPVPIEKGDRLRSCDG